MIGVYKMPMSPIKQNFRDEELSAGPGREALRQGLSTSMEGWGAQLHPSTADTKVAWTSADCRWMEVRPSFLLLRENASVACDEISPITRKTKLDTKDGEDGEVDQGKRA